MASRKTVSHFIKYTERNAKGEFVERNPQRLDAADVEALASVCGGGPSNHSPIDGTLLDFIDCANVSGLGFLLAAVPDRNDSHIPLMVEHAANGALIDWDFWVGKMPRLTAYQAVRLMAGLDPDKHPDLSSGVAAAAKNDAARLETLAKSHDMADASPQVWLEWADRVGESVHEGFRAAVVRLPADGDTMGEKRATTVDELVEPTSKYGIGVRLVDTPSASTIGTQSGLPAFPNGADRWSLWRAACCLSGQNPVEELPAARTLDALQGLCRHVLKHGGFEWASVHPDRAPRFRLDGGDALGVVGQIASRPDEITNWQEARRRLVLIDIRREDWELYVQSLRGAPLDVAAARLPAAVGSLEVAGALSPVESPASTASNGDALPQLKIGRNARADVVAWVKCQAPRLVKDGDTRDGLATRILGHVPGGAQSTRGALTAANIEPMLPAGITGGRKKNGKNLRNR
jgi:hypothetical protein